MNWVDIVIIVIISISAAISLMRGFVREALSLTSWVLAFWVAFKFSPILTKVLIPYIQTAQLRMVASFALLFLLTLITGSLIAHMLAQLVNKTGLGGTDRTLGMLFGGFRGVLLVSVIVIIVQLMANPTTTWWTNSRLLPHFKALALWVNEFLPDDLAGVLRAKIQIPNSKIT